MIKISSSLIIQIILVIFIGNCSKVNQLKLGVPIVTRLQPNKPYIYQVTIDNQTFIDSDLLFYIHSPANDPLQEPFLDIKTSDQDVQKCYSADDEFTGVCRLPKQKIHQNMTINATLLCYVRCTITINALFSNRFRPQLGNSIVFTAPKNDGMPIDVEIQIPDDLQYTQVFLYAKIMNFEEINQGIEMYANIGNQDTPQPTKDDYTVYGENIYWGGRGLFFSKQTLKPGDWIKVFLYLSQGMKVSFQSGIKTQNNYPINLGDSLFDFTTLRQGKSYAVNTKNTKIYDSTIVLDFLIYAGNPTIQVSLDQNYSHVLTSKEYMGTIIYLITNDQRIKNNFDGQIYVQVTSSWNSDYYISTSVSQNDYMFINHDRIYYNELQPDQAFNYFFDETVYSKNNTDIMHTYSIKVDMINGKGMFGVRLCPSTSQDSAVIKKCWISSLNDFSSPTVVKSFNQISLNIKDTDSYINIIFQYNVSNCPEMSSGEGYYCLFQIVVIDNTNDTIDYTLSYNKRGFSVLLREGHLSKDSIYKQQYIYYKLGLSSLQDVESIMIFATVLEGDIFLIASTSELYPTLNSNINSLKYGSSNDIFFSRDEIGKNIYIAVYGVQFSEFTIGAIVNRNNNSNKANNNQTTNNDNSQSTKINLQLDLSQQFTLSQDSEEVAFQISTPRPMNITVQLIQLVGLVSMEIIYSQDYTMTCRNPTISNAKITCSFTTIVGVNYTINVKAQRGDTQKFVILYHDQTHCTPYSLNMPFFVQLSSNNSQAGCALFTISKLTNLQITTSIPILQVLSQSLLMQVCIEDYCVDISSAHHFQISKADLKSYCQLGSSESLQSSCKIQLSYNSLSDEQLNFKIIVEQQGKDIILFDGISQKINSHDLTSSSGKYFYYYIQDPNSTIKIIFSSFTQTDFYLAAHFVEENQFFQNTTNIYLPFRKSLTNFSKTFSSNFYETIISGSNTNTLSISKDIINKYCIMCLLTVAVYPIDKKHNVLSLFEIQITQKETLLFPGDSKTGYLEQDQIYNYQLQGAQTGAVIYLHDLNKESNSQQDCFSAQVTDINDNNTLTIESGWTYLQRDSQFTDVYILTKDAVCHYQISFSLINTPLITMTSNKRYPVNLRNYGSAFFIYNHVSNDSFRIIDLVQSGVCFIYASPITNQTIQDLIHENYFTFPFQNTGQIGDFLINSSAIDFCYGCNYFIVVWGNPSVNLQILINDLETSIPLSISGVLSDKIQQTQKQRSYTYFSITAFNIKINMIYGKMQVIVYDPSSKELYNSVISKFTVINVPHYQGVQKQSIDFNSPTTRYLIVVRPVEDSSYNMKINKISITERIFEGISSEISVDSNKSAVLQFLNLTPLSALNANDISLLLSVIDPLPTQSQAIKLNAQVYLETEQGGQPKGISLNAFIQSDNSFNLQIPQQLGTYYINISSIQNLKLSVILVKRSLIHLKPSSVAIMSNSGNFQLYSKVQSVMIQVFTCSGEVSIESSLDYIDFSKNGKQANEVILDQFNIGGHYVISAEQIFGEYFIRVLSPLTDKTDMTYLIAYYFYNRNETSPYRLVNIHDRQILFSLTPTTITFQLRSISLAKEISSSIQVVYIEYRFYVSGDKNQVSQYANCRFGEVFMLQKNQSDVIQGIVSFPIEITSLKDIIGDNQNYFVGAEVVAYIRPTEKASANYPPNLRIIYEVIQLTTVGVGLSQTASTSSTSSVPFLIIWFVLPCLLATALLYISIKFCIKKYKEIPHEFIQQIGESREKMQLQDMSPYSDKNVNLMTVPEI